MLTKQLLVHKRTGEVPGLAVLVLAVVFPVEVWWWRWWELVNLFKKAFCDTMFLLFDSCLQTAKYYESSFLFGRVVG
jgi:hypothetical protein